MADILGKIYKYVVRVCNFLRTFRVNLFDGMPQTGRRAGGQTGILPLRNLIRIFALDLET